MAECVEMEESHARDIMFRDMTMVVRRMAALLVMTGMLTMIAGCADADKSQDMPRPSGEEWKDHIYENTPPPDTATPTPTYDSSEYYDQTPTPIATPTPAPIATPTPAPIATPTPAPTAAPTPAPTATPTLADPAGTWTFMGAAFVNGRWIPDVVSLRIAIVKNGSIYEVSDPGGFSLSLAGDNLVLKYSWQDPITQKQATATYTGKIKGDTIKGKQHLVSAGQTYDGPWIATRK